MSAVLWALRLGIHLARKYYKLSNATAIVRVDQRDVLVAKPVSVSLAEALAAQVPARAVHLELMGQGSNRAYVAYDEESDTLFYKEYYEESIDPTGCASRAVLRSTSGE